MAIVATNELPLTDIANFGQRLCVTQKENDPSITRHCLDLRGIQAALVNAAGFPQFTQFHVFMRQLNGKLNKVLIICHQGPRWCSSTKLTIMLTNRGVFADLSCNLQQFEFKDNVPNEADEVDGHV
jgi:hypothetical protein